jgi:hypothetical protein
MARRSRQRRRPDRRARAPFSLGMFEVALAVGLTIWGLYPSPQPWGALINTVLIAVLVALAWARWGPAE